MPSLIEVDSGFGDTFGATTTNILEIAGEAKQGLNFLVSQQLQDKLFWYKWSFIGVALLFLLLIFVILKKDGYDYFKTTFGAEIDERLSYKDLGLKKSQKMWQKIKSRLNKEGDVYYKLGLLEAEDFLENVLKRMGLLGNDAMERLGRLREEDLPNTTALNKALTICRDIVRDPDYKIGKEQAAQGIAEIEKSLVALNAL